MAKVKQIIEFGLESMGSYQLYSFKSHLFTKDFKFKFFPDSRLVYPTVSSTYSLGDLTGILKLNSQPLSTPTPLHPAKSDPPAASLLQGMETSSFQCLSPERLRSSLTPLFVSHPVPSLSGNPAGPIRNYIWEPVISPLLCHDPTLNHHHLLPGLLQCPPDLLPSFSPFFPTTSLFLTQQPSDFQSNQVTPLLKVCWSHLE